MPALPGAGQDAFGARMRYLGSHHLSPLTLILSVVVLVVLVVALLPRIASLTTTELSVAVIGVSAVVLALGGWAIRQTNRRLARLNEVANAIGEGDFSARAPIEGRDSIAALSKAINRMARRTESVIADLEERSREVVELSTHDVLTGFPAHRLFNELLVKELAHARRDGHKVAFLHMDVDAFMSINDGLGHEAADRILIQLAERLAGVTRDADTVARLDGDAFGVLLAGAENRADITQAIERIWQIYEPPFELGEQSIRISASGGLSVFPDSAATPELLLGQAESALEWVKGRGGKRWRWFESRMERHAGARFRLEQEFHRALQGDQLLVHYQPICSLTDGRVVGLEALVRWQHPESGFLSAGRFIPMLEQAGLMTELGAWLWEEICRQVLRWQDSGVSPVPVSVNVSVQQFDTTDIADLAATALAGTGLSNQFLQLEITESIAMRDVGQMIEQLDRCRERGLKIHLDDFGTGYSSLAYLLRFPVDVLKIDRTFVSGVPTDRHSVAIVRATLAMARSLGLAVIAEGVETEQQLEFLRREGCERAQGYLLGRPAPAEDTGALLASGRVRMPTTTPAHWVPV